MPAATLGLSFPTALSMVLIHAPYGHQPIAPFLTADGLTTAGILTVRFAALMGCILAAVTMTNVVDVAKWLQTSWVGYKVAFIVGTALQFLPEGRRAVDKINDANFLAGRPLKRHQLAIPVIAKLIVQGTERGAALAALGFDRPGKRTLLRPVPDRRAEKAFRIAVVIGTVLWLFK